MSSTAAPSAPIKQANKPFLVQKKYKEDQVAKKAAGGSNGGGGGALLSLLKWMVLALLTSVFLSRMVTETWLWGYEGQYSHPSKVRGAGRGGRGWAADVRRRSSRSSSRPRRGSSRSTSSPCMMARSQSTPRMLV